MSDIVERLRNHVNHRGGPTIENSAWQMMIEAADEIERLRAENEKLREVILRVDGFIKTCISPAGNCERRSRRFEGDGR